MAVGSGQEANDLLAMTDHEALKALLPHIGENQLPINEAIEAIRADENWMPAAIDPDRGLVHFVNIKGLRLGDEPFIVRIKELIGHQEHLECLSTSIDVLGEIETIGR